MEGTLISNASPPKSVLYCILTGDLYCIDMKIKIVQLKVEREIQYNRLKILKAIHKAVKNEWIVFPEAAVSGYYPHEKVYTAALNWSLISDALNEIEKAVKARGCFCILGSATKIGGTWRNSIIVFSPTGPRAIHHKMQLSDLDKKHFYAGNTVKSYTKGNVSFGLQACRELLFPEQWSKLKKAGASIVFHINNAIQPKDALWKHILITRAIEHSVFVVSVNNASHPQALASYIISPGGKILAETTCQIEEEIHSTIDLKQVILDLSRRKDY